jgi:hypothetical protein
VESNKILNEFRYVKLANTMYRVLRNSRIPLFFIEKTTISSRYGTIEYKI